MSDADREETEDRTCAYCGATLPPIQSFTCQFVYRDDRGPFGVNAFVELCSYGHLRAFVAESGPEGVG